jgi:hypothetical protein
MASKLRRYVVYLITCFALGISFVFLKLKHSYTIKHVRVNSLNTVNIPPSYSYVDSRSLGRCRWSANQTYNWNALAQGPHANRWKLNEAFAAFAHRLAKNGVPVVLRNGNALVARRQRPSMDSRVFLDIDVHIIVPKDEFQSTMEYINKLAAQEGFSFMFKPTTPFNFMIFGEVDMWKSFPDAIVDATVLSEHLLFENRDFELQNNIMYGMNMSEAFQMLCYTNYFGHDVLAHKDPYQKNLLRLHYGKSVLRSSNTTTMFNFNIIYPRWYLRTAVGRWLHCFFGSLTSVHPIHGFFFHFSSSTQTKMRNADDQLLKPLDYNPRGDLYGVGCGRRKNI